MHNAGRGESGAAARTDRTSGAANAARARTSAATPAAGVEPKTLGEIQPCERNHQDPVTAGTGKESGKWGNVEVRRKWLAAEKTTAARNSPRDRGESRARAIGNAAKKSTGSRYRLPSDQPPCQFG